MRIIDNSKLNTDQKLYKYMDLEKFLSLIVKSELCFCNQKILKNIDPYEGAMTKEELIRDVLVKELINITTSVDRFKALKITNDIDTLYIDLKDVDNFKIYDDTSFYIDCWHINTCESLAMWKVFSDNKNSIAITTTKAKLISGIKKNNKNIYLEKVYYEDLTLTPTSINLGNQSISLNDNIITIHSDIIYGLCSNRGLLRKSEYFEYEKELRLFFEDIDCSDIVQFIPIELNTIIDEIIISPNCDDWFLEILNSLLKKYNLTNFIKYSDIMKNNINVSEYESEKIKDLLNSIKLKKVN